MAYGHPEDRLRDAAIQSHLPSFTACGSGLRRYARNDGWD